MIARKEAANKEKLAFKARHINSKSNLIFDRMIHAAIIA